MNKGVFPNLAASHKTKFQTVGGRQKCQGQFPGHVFIGRDVCFLLTPFCWLKCGYDGWCLSRYLGKLGVANGRVAGQRRRSLVTVEMTYQP